MSDPTITPGERARVADALTALFGDEPALADANPLFYAVSGSRIYGFADEDSDVDVRGIHVVDADEYVRLDPPAEQYVLDPADAVGGDGAEIDLVSCELRKFGSLLADGNFNAFETVLAGDPVANESPPSIDALRTLVGDALPLDVPRRYYGMARSNYRAFSGRDAGAESSAKASLYAIRGALAAAYTAREAAIEADVAVLADWWGDDDLAALVAALVEEKRRGSGAPSAESAARADAAIRRLLGAVEPELSDAGADGTRYRERLDEWMLATRAEVRRAEGGE